MEKLPTKGVGAREADDGSPEFSLSLRCKEGCQSQS